MDIKLPLLFVSFITFKDKIVDRFKKKIFNIAIVGLGNIGLNLYKHLIDNIQSIKKKTKIIKIKNLWIVRQFKNDYNPIHFHNGDISGVGYLKIPKNLTKGDKKLKTNGTIDFIYGSKSFLNNSIYNHIPKVGDLILFPNYLMHTAYPFKIDGERRSFSFNLEIDKTISSIFNE